MPSSCDLGTLCYGDSWRGSPPPCSSMDSRVKSKLDEAPPAARYAEEEESFKSMGLKFMGFGSMYSSRAHSHSAVRRRIAFISPFFYYYSKRYLL